MSIYVEIMIRGDLDDLWEKTQDPKLHQRWDLRFTEIDYIPREVGEPQRFLYSTRIGAGIHINGEGESTGERDTRSGQRTSALKFWSDDAKSLIDTGSGYWKYVPIDGGVRFFTLYDYRTRFGVVGRIVDRFVFRPLIGWATAWSFDRLRLWIEKGLAPETSRNLALVYGLTRIAIAFVFFYHGLIPKLLYRSPDELAMLHNVGTPLASQLTSLAGWLEIGFAILLLVFWRALWPLWVTVVGMALATLMVGVSAPGYFHNAFDPLTLNLSVAILAISGIVTAKDTPTAKNCLRNPKEGSR